MTVTETSEKGTSWFSIPPPPKVTIKLATVPSYNLKFSPPW